MTGLIFVVLTFSTTGTDMLYAVVAMSIVSALVSPIYGHAVHRFNPTIFLLFSLLGTGISMIAIAVFAHSTVTVVVCVASIPLSGTTSLLTRLLIADLPASSRPQWFASLTFAQQSTQLFTPALVTLCSTLSPQAPFYLMGAINVLAFCIPCCYFGLCRSRSERKVIKPTRAHSQKARQSARGHWRTIVRYWCFTVFANLELPFFSTTLPLILVARYEYPPWKYGLFNTLTVCVLLAFNRFLYSPQKRMLRYLGVKGGMIAILSIYAMPGFALAFAGLDRGSESGEMLLWVLVPIKGACFQTMIPLALTLITSSIPNELQGFVMGLNSTIMLITLPVGNIICTFLFTNIGAHVYLLGSGLLLCSLMNAISLVRHSPYREDGQHARVMRRCLPHFFSPTTGISAAGCAAASGESR